MSNRHTVAWELPSEEQDEIEEAAEEAVGEAIQAIVRDAAKAFADWSATQVEYFRECVLRSFADRLPDADLDADLSGAEHHGPYFIQQDGTS